MGIVSKPNFAKRGLVYGVGVNDYNGSIKINGCDLKPYRVWKDMLKRCYSDSYKQKYPTYNGVHCDPNWLLFSNFLKDTENMNNAFKDGFSLDKDLFGDGFYYSKDTCCFLPNKINITLPMVSNKRLKSDTGVRFMDKKYCVRITIDGKEINLGRYHSKDEAIAVSNSARKKYLRNLALEYKDVLSSTEYIKMLSICD